MLHIDIGCLSW